MEFDEYQNELGKLRHRARVSTEVNECLEIYDRVQDILNSPEFHALDEVRRITLYRSAVDVYKPIIGSLAQLAKESQGFEKKILREL